MKTRKFTAMLLTLAMAFSLLTVSAGAVMDNDHDRISVDTAGPLSVVWDSETVDSEAYHTGDIVSSEDGYYPSSFYLYVDSAEENGITLLAAPGVCACGGNGGRHQVFGDQQQRGQHCD